MHSPTAPNQAANALMTSNLQALSWGPASEMRTGSKKKLQFIARLAGSHWRDSRTIRCFYTGFASGWCGVQSFGGKATRQNVGLGSMNSTPTCVC